MFPIDRNTKFSGFDNLKETEEGSTVVNRIWIEKGKILNFSKSTCIAVIFLEGKIKDEKGNIFEFYEEENCPICYVDDEVREILKIETLEDSHLFFRYGMVTNEKGKNIGFVPIDIINKVDLN